MTPSPAPVATMYTNEPARAPVTPCAVKSFQFRTGPFQDVHYCNASNTAVSAFVTLERFSNQ
jgi:hypothetical protein